MTHVWQSHGLQVIGWTLLHTLWQGGLVSAAAALAFRILRGRGPQAKYLAACASLAAMLALAVGTYACLAAAPQSSQLTAPAAHGAPMGAGAVGGPAGAVGATSSGPAGALPRMAPHIVPWLAVAWLAGVLVFSVWLLGGWCWLFGGVVRGAAPAPSEWQWRLDALSRPLGVTKKVRLLVSERAGAVLALGWLRPAVLLPASALLRLSPESLEAILAHELAHIARHDFMVNLFQSIVDVLFFYHPAVRWLSGQARELREYCCDDDAARHCGSGASYAGALADLETLRAGGPPQLAPAAKGASIMKRIQRLLGVPFPTAAGVRSGLVAAAAVSVMGASALWGFPQDGGRPQETQKIVIRDGGKSLRVITAGRVDLAQGVADGAVPEDGSAMVIAESGSGAARRLAVRREGSQVKRTYSVNGKEMPLDAEAKAWIDAKVAEIGSVQVRKSRIGTDGGNVTSFSVTEDGGNGKDAKVIVYSYGGRGTNGPSFKRLPPHSDIDALEGLVPEELEGLLKDPSRLKRADVFAFALPGGLSIEEIGGPEALGDQLEDLDQDLDLNLGELRAKVLRELQDLDLDLYLGEGALAPDPSDQGRWRPRVRVLRRGTDAPGDPENSGQGRRELLQRRMDALQKRLARLQEEMDRLDRK